MKKETLSNMRRNKPAEAAAAKTPPYYREEVWNKLASLYDPLLKLILLPFGGEKGFRKTLIDFANPRKGEQVLDVCSGTGTLTSLIAERVGSSGMVIGVDLSVRMIRIAREKVKDLAVTFQRADTESLPFAEGMFDKSFLSLGLHEMPQIARRNTLREIYRTLKPGGKLFVLDHSLPNGVFPRLVIKALVKLLEEEAAYRMLLEGTLTTEIEEAGFILKGRELALSGMVEIIRADKPLLG